MEPKKRPTGERYAELMAGVLRIAAGGQGEPIKADCGDELDDLAAMLNAMGRRLLELEDLKSSFLAQITHDLRNPLTASIGFLELTLLRARGRLDAEQIRWLTIVLDNTIYLSELVNNILDQTRLDAGRMEYDIQPNELAPCVAWVLGVMKVKASEFGIALDCTKVPAGVQVWADEQSLRRVLFNLVSNALKFTPSGGRVSIEYSPVAGPDGEGHDELAVCDTGIGIPADKISSLFKRFSQVEENRNKVRKAFGTGLGLTICKQLVEGHGGRIWVESRVQEGTVFRFTLPRRRTPIAVAAEAAR